MDTSEEEDQQEREGQPAPEDVPGEPGAEGGSETPAANVPPAKPSQDESALGDTDQHSAG